MPAYAPAASGHLQLSHPAPSPPSTSADPSRHGPHSPDGVLARDNGSRYREQPVDFTDLDSENSVPEPKQSPAEAPAPRLLATTVIEVILFLLYLAIPNTRLYENDGVVAAESYTGDSAASEGQTLDGIWFGCTFISAGLAFWPAKSDSFSSRILAIVFLKFILGFIFAYRIATASAFVLPLFGVGLAVLLVTIVVCFMELNAVHLRLIAEDVNRTRVHDDHLQTLFDQLDALKASPHGNSDAHVEGRADGESPISAAFRRLLSAWDFEWGRLLVSKHMHLANNVFAATCFIFFALYIGNFSSEISKILSTQATIMPATVLTALKANFASAAYSGTPWQPSASSVTPLTGASRVQLVVLDGMRFDMLTEVSDMAALLNEYKADLIVRKMRAQLPTMSVPNWITLLTAAPPEWSGVLGNLLVPETKYALSR
jgi:hypothetical protein